MRPPRVEWGAEGAAIHTEGHRLKVTSKEAKRLEGLAPLYAAARGEHIPRIALSERGGMWDDEINAMLVNYQKKGFLGVYAADEWDRIYQKWAERKPRLFSFITNTKNKNQPGEHWVATYVDLDRDKGEWDYYNSLGDAPPKSYMRGATSLIHHIHPDIMLKLKWSAVRYQRANSSTCGLFAALFVIRRSEGEAFNEASGFTGIESAEKNVRLLKENIKYGYI